MHIDFNNWKKEPDIKLNEHHNNYKDSFDDEV